MNGIGLTRLLFGLLGQWLLGIFVARMILAWRDKARPVLAARTVDAPHDLNNDNTAELLGLGCVLGVGLTAWFLFLWSYLGGELGILPSGALAILGYISGSPILVGLWRKRIPSATRNQKLSEEAQQDRAVSQVCQTIISILFLVTLLQTLQTPQKLWDERAIFALKGIVLFEDRSIHSPALAHPDFVQYHPKYPLLLPLAEQNIYALLGSVDDRLSKLIFTQLYCGLVLTTAGVLCHAFCAARAWLASLLTATIPVLMPYEYGFICGQADAPTGCYHGLSVLYLWDFLSRQRAGRFSPGSIFVAGVLGGLAAFTKDEGIAYLLIDGAVLGLFTLASLVRLDQAKRLVVGGVLYVTPVICMLAPWFAHRRNLPVTTEMNYAGRMTVDLFLSRLDTLSWSVPHLISRMFRQWNEWGLQWWLMLTAFVAAPRRILEPARLLLLLDVAGALAALVVAGMIAPAQLDEHIGGSSHRFLMQIAPVAVLFAVTGYFHEPCQSQTSDAA